MERIQLLLEVDWTTTDAVDLFTDAFVTLGSAGYFNGRWFQSRWSDWLKTCAPSIQFLEMLPISAACTPWKEEFARPKLFSTARIRASYKPGAISPDVELFFLPRDLFRS